MRAKNIQVPVGYGWAPKPIFSKYSYMKSHDWKQVATDGILKFCFRNPLLGKSQRTTIFKLFDILAALCDDIQDSRQVEALEEEINVVLALIERDFPISIQTISMHMLHHVARGISCHGPVHSWSMYVYERMNSWICRRVTNRCHPEANVMETYRIFDWCQFMNRDLKQRRQIGRRRR
ncbi:uncharacterized protein [Montipora capricornis]|uniref:uncharacterized protein isoform X1 n=1 Tax=Montipora capricornis TaxID=246305 RepID=UPI0035F15855